MTPEPVPDELRARFDALSTPLVLVDGSGLIAFANPRAAQALAPRPGGLIGWPATLLPPGWVPESRTGGPGAPLPASGAFTPFILTDGTPEPFAPPPTTGAPKPPAPDSRPGAEPHVPTESLLCPRNTFAAPVAAAAPSPLRRAPEDPPEAARLAAPAVGMITVAPDQRVLSANRAFCELTGYAAHDLTRMTAGDVLFPEERARGEALLAAVAAGRTATGETDLRLRRPDGAPVWVRIGATALDDAPPARVSVLVLDQTDQHAAEERLLRLQSAEMVGLRASCLAHDFNNLLTIISGCVSLLLEGTPATNPARALAQQVTAACQRAAGLTAQLSTLTRPTPAESEVVELNEVAAGAARLLRPLLGPHIALVCDFTAPDRVRVDPIQIEQAVLNLALNAKDAMPDGGALAIETHTVRLEDGDPRTPPGLPPGVYARLTVSDTGHGMTDEVKTRAFEPFFTTKGAGKGTGLGLAAVRAAVERSGGRVRVYSEVGVGTVFEILLPAVATDATPAVAPGHSGAPRIGTFLIVGATDATRKLAHLALKTQGHEVLEADCAPAALRLAQERSGPIDLVLLGDDDHELAGALRRGRSGIKVIAIQNESGDALRPPEAPFPVVRGPFAPFSFARTVRALLNEPG